MTDTHKEVKGKVITADLSTERRIKRTPDYKRLYAIGGIGAITKYDFRLILFDSIIYEGEEKGTVTSNGELILTWLAVKEFARYLTEQVRIHEEQNGEIKEPKPPEGFVVDKVNKK